MKTANALGFTIPQSLLPPEECNRLRRVPERTTLAPVIELYREVQWRVATMPLR